MRFLLPVALCVLLAAQPAWSHPHSKVNQQLLISKGIGKVVLTARIKSSDVGGRSVYSAIDRNSDGDVSAHEAKTFGD